MELVEMLNVEYAQLRYVESVGAAVPSAKKAIIVLNALKCAM